MWWPFTNSKDKDSVSVSSETEADWGEFDPDLLEQLGEKWMDDYMGELDGEVKRILWEAIEACRQNGKEK